jgi:hypothetical protein
MLSEDAVCRHERDQELGIVSIDTPFEDRREFSPNRPDSAAYPMRLIVACQRMRITLLYNCPTIGLFKYIF